MIQTFFTKCRQRNLCIWPGAYETGCSRSFSTSHRDPSRLRYQRPTKVRRSSTGQTSRSRRFHDDSFPGIPSGFRGRRSMQDLASLAPRQWWRRLWRIIASYSPLRLQPFHLYNRFTRFIPYMFMFIYRPPCPKSTTQ
jgi:hypothetical protein